jgi:hypothetical protein
MQPAHLLQLGLLLGSPAQQGVGQARSGIGGPGAVSRGATVGPRHQVSQPRHGGLQGGYFRTELAKGLRHVQLWCHLRPFGKAW